MKYFVIIIFIIIILFLSFYNSMSIEHFSNNTQITLYNFAYGNKVTPFNEIFPLKKYKFYNRKLYGPNKLDTIVKIYSKDDKNYMLYGKRKYGPDRKLFKINNFNPANINNQNYNGCTKETLRCKFTTKQNYLTPPCCANHLTELLFYITNLFDKHNITYFIYYGTLLGAVRHKGVIPWDTDVDIFIDIKSKHKLEKLKKIIDKDTHYKLSMSKHLKNPSRLSYSSKNILHIDIYLYKII